MIDNLLPCPFCGHAARLLHDTHSDYERHWRWNVECANLGECEAELTGFASAEAAIAKWNSRRTTYAHRNGETQPPTEPGQYWFDGNVLGIEFQAMTATADGTSLAWFQHKEEGWYQSVSSFAGQWWRSVNPPWATE